MQAANGALCLLVLWLQWQVLGIHFNGRLKRDTSENFLVLFGTPRPHRHPLLTKNRVNFKQLWAASAGLTKRLPLERRPAPSLVPAGA
jgi:hypothetical protein